MLVQDKGERRRQMLRTRNLTFVMFAGCIAAIWACDVVPMMVGLAVNAFAWLLYMLLLTTDLHETRRLD